MRIDIEQLADDHYRKGLRDTLGDEDYRMAVINQLLQAYQDDVYVYCARWLDRASGEYIAGEVFVLAWQSLLSYQGKSTPRTWLIGIARNMCLKFTRDSKRHRQLEETWQADIQQRVHGDAPASPEAQLSAAQAQEAQRRLKARLAVCIGRLPEKDRLPFELKYLKQRPVADIAAFLDVKQDTLYKRLKRALQRVKECVQDES